ncbi:MAG: zinc ribbon domain-containing protein [Chloroflexota bacterium]|jgi:putative FmdB family regulatory protein
MASYDYRCGNCGNVFTVRATFKEKEAGLDPVCPVCHVQDAKQVIGVPMLAGVGAGDKRIPIPVQSGSCCGASGGCGCG